MKIDLYYQRQKRRPMTGESNESGLPTTAIIGDLSGYFFGNFRDKASNIICRYATPNCRLVTDCKMNDLE